FALIPTIVQTFGCCSQILERMYMATHSSFFAMVGVAEQVGSCGMHWVAFWGRLR
ncbi:hypothetical protein BU17DRAFT_56778, partial [Hysterangium stoloniferum]